MTGPHITQPVKETCTPCCAGLLFLHILDELLHFLEQWPTTNGTSYVGLMPYTARQAICVLSRMAYNFPFLVNDKLVLSVVCYIAVCLQHPSAPALGRQRSLTVVAPTDPVAIALFLCQWYIARGMGVGRGGGG